MAFSLRAKYTRFIIFVGIFTLVLYTLRDRISDGAYYGWQTSLSGAVKNGHLDWSKLPVRYPVTSLHALPTGKPHKLPKIQRDFPRESTADKNVREVRQTAVRDAFLRGWKSYKKHAWMADELVSLVDMFSFDLGVCFAWAMY